jgi:hypothetical protein
MGLLSKIREAMTNQGGALQGGKYGRPLGRLQDAFEGMTQKGRDYGTDLSRRFDLQDVIPGQGTQVDQNVFGENDPRANQDFTMARTAGMDVDPSDPNSVRSLQQRLITMGLLPQGADDAMFGPQTEGALRKMQSFMPMDDPTGQQGLMSYLGQNAPSTAERLGQRTGEIGEHIYEQNPTAPGSSWGEKKINEWNQ